MTQEKLTTANDLNQKIKSLKAQLNVEPRMTFLSECGDCCTRTVSDWAAPLDKELREQYKKSVERELNKAQKEFDKL
jgi:hypothetical protein